MKAKHVLPLACVILATIVVALAQDRAASTKIEYVTIQWDGKKDTHLIRPGGKVEFIGSELGKLPPPDRSDERSFYMNAAMNGLAGEGYEFAGMTEDTIVMRRVLTR